MVVGSVNLHLTVQVRVALRFVVHAELVEEFELGTALWHTVGAHSFVRLFVPACTCKIVNGGEKTLLFGRADVRIVQLMAAVVKELPGRTPNYIPSSTENFVGFALSWRSSFRV